MFTSSRYQFSIGTQDEEGRSFLSTPDAFRYVNLADNIPHVVQGGDTLFSLAGYYYAEEPRAAGLWWMIGHFQPEPICHDPTVMLVDGSIVIVPSLRTVRSKILNARRRRGTV